MPARIATPEHRLPKPHLQRAFYSLSPPRSSSSTRHPSLLDPPPLTDRLTGPISRSIPSASDLLSHCRPPLDTRRHEYTTAQPVPRPGPPPSASAGVGMPPRTPAPSSRSGGPAPVTPRACCPHAPANASGPAPHTRPERGPLPPVWGRQSVLAVAVAVLGVAAPVMTALPLPAYCS